MQKERLCCRWQPRVPVPLASGGIIAQRVRFFRSKRNGKESKKAAMLPKKEERPYGRSPFEEGVIIYRKKNRRYRRIFMPQVPPAACRFFLPEHTGAEVGIHTYGRFGKSADVPVQHKNHFYGSAFAPQLVPLLYAGTPPLSAPIRKGKNPKRQKRFCTRRPGGAEIPRRFCIGNCSILSF